MRTPDLILVAAAGASAVFHLLAAARLRAHFRAPLPRPGDIPPFPVTFLRPIKPGTPGLRENLEALVRCARPGDQILAAVSCEEDRLVAGTIPGIETLCARDPEAANPKVAKLIPMARAARHAHWILTDSEALLDPPLAGALRAEWGGDGLLTAGYRFAGETGWPGRLDHAALLASFWPGLAFAPKRYALGAFVALRRDDLDRIGGWGSLGQYLAEDHQLGLRMARAGVRVRLARSVLPLRADPMGWGEWFAHQLRVAVTLRHCAPLGWAGSAVTHGAFPALLLAALGPHEAWRWGALAAALALRALAASSVARTVGARGGWIPAAACAVALLEPFFWAASWVVRHVRWGGARYAVRPGGILRRAGNRGSFR